MDSDDNISRKIQILVADDDSAIRTVLGRALGQAGYEVRLATNIKTLWNWISQDLGDVVISDVVMPDGNLFDFMSKFKNSRPNLPIIIMSAQNTLMTAIKANEAGAYEYLPKPFDLTKLQSVVERAVKETSSNVSAILSSDENQDGIPLIGRSPAMQDVYRVLARMMQNDLTLMISGESGTGKELVARALHDFGKRKKGPFVAINMAAIPRDLIESELFGHEKGAFTGAQNRSMGQFEHAQGGTLFLDEIGDMPLEAQTRLLRVLQQGEYTTVGGRLPIKTDVRIIAATNKNLQSLISQGLFREDLFYRLNVVPMRLPPLRERIEDIVSLVDHFMQQSVADGNNAKIFSEDAYEILKEHQWPGNVRELENLVRRLCVLYQQDMISAEIIRSELSTVSFGNVSQNEELNQNVTNLTEACESYFGKLFDESGNQLQQKGLYHKYLREFERPLIAATLMATNSNQIKAAEILGLNRNTLRKKIRELGISTKRTIA
ncbi:MAG: nitrogen regulation protein NR(I) [Hyphomicrobiales bacterium]|nr:nitrogen regulation protein NR(I) [Hyphomicrobiales bacterium]